MVPVLRGIKYHDTFAACGELAEMMAAKYHYKYSFDCFVPIPLSKSRERERGYNQAEKLAGALKQIMDNRYEMKDKKIENGDREQEGKKPLPAVVPLLQRIRETKPQFDLTYKERRKNVRGAFAVATRYLPLATSLCLVDDVATTGATVFECAKVLKRAGAKYVYALCAARGG
jgi:predicted amidophosphoribosyltransferase